MPSCQDPEMKYIRAYEAGYIVEISRADKQFVKKFPFRTNGGMTKTLEAAKAERDSQHIVLFGYPVSRRFFHIKKRKQNGEPSDLPAGISHGYSRNKLLYIVASFSDKEGKPSRKRYNIKKLGYDEALQKAVEFLQEKRIEIITKLDQITDTESD